MGKSTCLISTLSNFRLCQSYMYIVHVPYHLRFPYRRHTCAHPRGHNKPRNHWPLPVITSNQGLHTKLSSPFHQISLRGMHLRFTRDSSSWGSKVFRILVCCDASWKNRIVPPTFLAWHINGHLLHQLSRKPLTYHKKCCSLIFGVDPHVPTSESISNHAGADCSLFCWQVGLTMCRVVPTAAKFAGFSTGTSDGPPVPWNCRETAKQHTTLLFR